MSAVEVLEVGTPRAAGWSAGRLLASELGIIFRRRRNIAGLGVLAVVPIIIAVAVWWSDDGDGRGGPGFFEAITGNGLFVAFAALAVELPLFLPFAVSVIAGDSVAGEANIGTLRYLLTIPVGRTRLLVVKYAAIVIFALAATALVAVVGTIAGVALFGGGDMTVFSGDRISMAEGLYRLLLSVGYLGVQFSALGAFALFVSTLTEQPIGAMVAAVLTNVLMFILDTIDQLDWLHPWLLTHWWMAFGDLMRSPIATDNLERGLLTAGAYAAVFWLAAWARFSGKDVTS